MLIGITGNLGYIGCLLCKQLMNQGYDIIGVDNNSFNKQDKIIGVEQHNICISDFYNLQECFKNVDMIIHLAAISGVDDCNKYKVESQKKNINGVSNIATICK